MAQPPDGRRPMPWEPPDPVPPAEAPTVAWTPPDDVDAPVADPLIPPAPASADPQNPLISWSPSGGTSPHPTGPDPASPGSATPGAPPAVVGWETPRDARQAAPIAGYVVAGTASRFVAYLVDAVVLGIANILVIAISDPGAFDPDRPIPSSASLGVLFGKLIVLGLEFAYFVGFWTGRRRATPGMLLLRIELIDARADRPLVVIPAAARWLLLSGAIGLLGLLPIAPGIFGLASLIWLVVLLASVLANPLRQGIHDQAAGSLVVQRVGVTSNAAVVGCLLLVVVFVILPLIGLIFMGGLIEQYLLEVGQSI
jgi:uncharacterized RDD family membrane protein YckC